MLLLIIILVIFCENELNDKVYKSYLNLHELLHNDLYENNFDKFISNINKNRIKKIEEYIVNSRFIIYF